MNEQVHAQEVPYSVLLNDSDDPYKFLTGYEPHHPMDLVYRGAIADWESDRALEAIWFLHNEYAPVPGVRSLSVGDVVLLGEVAWAVKPVGWEQVPTPEHIVHHVGGRVHDRGHIEISDWDRQFDAASQPTTRSES